MARQLRFWLIGLLVFLFAVFLLRSVLLPFVAGMAIAYFLDPLCDRLEDLKLSRTMATTLVTLIFLMVGVASLLVLVPTLINQITNLLARSPQYIEALRGQIFDLLAMLEAKIHPEVMKAIEENVSGVSGKLFAWLAAALGQIVEGGVAFANLLSLLIVTPVVTFYLLRDWDRIVARVNGWLPRRHAEVIRAQVREVDRTLAGFIRGQGTVCLLLGGFYALALSLVGLDFGLVVGLVAGFLSFIPYVGSVIGLVLSVGLAFVQFSDWVDVAMVAAVFFAGQAIEGNVLTPKLVGERVGLHPVWVIFGLFAGGALFGIVGIILAVPLAAVIGVAVRFLLGRYLDSAYFHGNLAAAKTAEGEAASLAQTAGRGGDASNGEPMA